MKIETLIGIGIWVMIFVVWYVRTYPEKFKDIIPFHKVRIRWPRKKTDFRVKPHTVPTKDFSSLVEKVESICAKDRFDASDAAAMVEAVRQLLQIEPASGQIWEAYALDSLETAEIICDECRIPVDKIVKKTGIRIQCIKCGKWLALRNSKVTVIDPNRRDLEEWERFH